VGRAPDVHLPALLGEWTIKERAGDGLTGSEDGFGGAREREGLMKRPNV